METESFLTIDMVVSNIAIYPLRYRKTEYGENIQEKINKQANALILGCLQIYNLRHPEYQKCDFILPNLPEPTKE